MTFLEQLSEKLGNKQVGHQTNWIIEMYGGEMIIPTAFEPDATTHRSDYYYNATDNKLYTRKKIYSKDGNVIACWK